MGQHPNRILFVCVENACRSQMAAGFARALAPDHFEIYSAGSRPSGVVNPRAIQFMAEVGIDISKESSKSISEVPQQGYAAVVTMGCGDACPFIKAERHIDWSLPDPKLLSDDEFRRIRDEIKARVEALLKSVT
ncbi:MAG: arsenate reductase ArsC [Planctomycetaceae bacterium]|nr:arsenate reductase ArsC [Planctomycetaceae bacterium]